MNSPWALIAFCFDRRKSCTYHTFTMSSPLYVWYSLNELEALGRRQAQLNGKIEIGRLTRLCELLMSDKGSVSARFEFSQQGVDRTTVDLSYKGTLDLVCQRCLESVTEEISGRVLFVILEDDSMVSSAPEDHEPIVLSGIRCQPAEIVEDELIISLPLVARHSQIDECGSLVKGPGVLTSEDEVGLADPSFRGH